MPIFEKNGRRVYFAHIPKTAGTSIYIAFAASGWAIYNIEKGKTAQILKKRFGTEWAKIKGRRFLYPHPVQHAPKFIWKTWGPFDESFCVVRHPEERLKSALKYYYQGTEQKNSFSDFTNKTLRKLTYPMQRSVSSWRLLHGHLIPQTYFAAKDSCVFYFEQDWQSRVADQFKLKLEDFQAINQSQPQEVMLSPKDRELIREIYKKDFSRFNYP